MSSTIREASDHHRVWLFAHLVSLLLILATLLYAARGQWFFYDEWDFLAERAEWALLAPHNGHLSFFPQLLTTSIKGIFGLHTYWPYLACTIVVHLLIVHFLWRLVLLVGANPLFAVLTTTAFGVCAAAAENTLWAFQIGFIAPIATGIAAMLLAMRASFGRRQVLLLTVLLLIGIGSAGTAIPMTVAVLAFVWLRHGWQTALWPAVVVGGVYSAWYLVFNILLNRSDPEAETIGVRTLGELLVRVPEYVLTGLSDSLGKMTPLDTLGPVLLVITFLWTVIDLRRRSRRDGLMAVHILAAAAVLFAFLTAMSRLQLGPETASSGRYVYVYAALLTPIAAAVFTRFAGGSRLPIIVVGAVLAVNAAFNAGGLIVAGAEQSTLEQTVNRGISAALTLDDGSPELANRTPVAETAPTLTMADIRSFVSRGQFTPVPFTPTDLLDARVNMYLTATRIEGDAPDGAECAPEVDGSIPFDPASQNVFVPKEGGLRVSVQEGDVVTSRAQIPISEAGMNELSGLGPSFVLRLSASDAGGVCVLPKH